ncbi:MAG: hypothetical protein OHK0026_00710 [Rhodocyclaceae bacterium]
MCALPGGFVPDALEAPLAPLEALPRSLWLQGIVNSAGRLHTRLAWLAELRGGLTAGMLPPVERWLWPAGKPLEVFAAALAELELARYCEGREEVTDQVLASLLFHTDRIIDYRNEWDEDGAIEEAARAFRADWKERTGEIGELVYVFGDLGEALEHDRWDITRGLLRSTGWQEMLRIRGLLENLPELSRLIRRLGRARQTEEPDRASHVQARLMEESAEPVHRTRRTRVPDLPGETRSVRRSGRLSRMLAQEAMLLPHPRLRMVWFARHAERILMTYEDDDLLEETVLVEEPAPHPSPARRPGRRLEMGPIVVCVDTSGSMRGASEDVAKACVLEALRAARAQARACYAFAFGGPGEIVERELGLDPRGIADAIDFLTQSFHGGTEVSEVVLRATARVRDEGWRFADLLIASDGEFGPSRDAVARLRAVKSELGLRVQGILIGDRETIGMLETCDDIFWVRDWRRFGGGGSCPVHSRSLTAEYFPGALRSAGDAVEVRADRAAGAVSGRPPTG